MQKALMVVGLLAALVGGVKAADADLDMDLMQQIEDTNKSLSSNIALQDVKGSRSDAEELRQMFAQVETYFVHKGDAADAVDLSKKSLDLTSAVVSAVQTKQFDAAAEASATLSRTCRACHTFYKKS